MYEISPCNGNTIFEEVPPTNDGLNGIGTIKGHGAVRCSVGDSVREYEVLTNAPIHGEPHNQPYFNFLEKIK